jgi:hypothetical protein
LFSRVFGRFGLAGPVAVLAAIAVTVAASVPAAADPVANAAVKLAAVFKLAKKANKKATAANKKATRALRQGGEAGAQGPAGPRGAVGPQGPAGQNGTNGADGTGTNGTDGASVESSAEPPGPNCANGGSQFDVVPGGDPPTFACNGEDGSPWTIGGTLPPEETLTGTWSVSTFTLEEDITGQAPISYGLPLESAATVNFVASGTTADCPGAGNASNPPQAEPGHLCVYSTFPSGATSFDQTVINGPGGAVLAFDGLGDAAFDIGVWAVTAPTAGP